MKKYHPPANRLPADNPPASRPSTDHLPVSHPPTNHLSPPQHPISCPHLAPCNRLHTRTTTNNQLPIKTAIQETPTVPRHPMHNRTIHHRRFQSTKRRTLQHQRSEIITHASKIQVPTTAKI
ncbi:hypothetical protein RP20_CCG000464 [Aedes albopictus]|nr:hypothetical protein RP20_CCG000464 [Aedes albopictus]